MSHEATAWATGQKVGNSPTKFVLMILADYADTEYSCFPSVGHLSKITELGESTIRKALALLTERGLIRVYGRHRPDGSQRSSRYQLLVHGLDTDRIEPADWTYVREGGVSDGEGGSLGAGPGGVSEGEAIPISDPPPSDPPLVTPAASRSKAATRVPEDFAPDEKMRAWYAAQQFGDSVNGLVEHEKFMDYWRACPGIKGRKTDWPATWRNWMREASERAQRRGHRPGNALTPVSGAPRQYPSTTDGKVMQTLALAEKFRQMEENQ